MGLAITKVQITPQNVTVNSVFKIAVVVKEIQDEPAVYRLHFKLGNKKGGIK